MTIYYFMFEAIPLADNPESYFCKGAFINCWIKSTDEESALKDAINYIRLEEGWQVTKMEECYIPCRDQYERDNELKDSLECYDLAVNNGIGVLVHTWSDNEEDDD